MSKFINKLVTAASSVAMVAMMFAPSVANVTHAATAGEVYKTTDGTVWFITSDMQRRPFTSWGAFQSYGFLSQAQIKEADSSVTSLTSGSFIAPQDGRIFCATATKGTDVAGECSLITGGKKAAFTSASVFAGQGFSFSRAFYGDSSFLAKTSNVDNASAQHMPGTLINNNGTVQLVVSGGLWGVPSMDVFNSWGWSFADVVPANSADKLLSQVGVIPARMAGMLVPTATTGGSTGGSSDCKNLSGNAGDVTVTENGDYTAEDISEGDQDQGIVGFDVEADDSSDVAVTSVKVTLSQPSTTNGASQKLSDYFDHISIFMGDKEVGSADSSDFTKSSTGVYTKTISLDCAAVMAGETGDFSVRATANDNLDSIDVANESWSADVNSIRFTDGDGVTSTKTISTVSEPIHFVSFSVANDIELKTSLTAGEEAINEAHNITIDNTDKTLKEPVLAFTLRNAGDADLWVDEIPVTFTTAGQTDESLVISKAYLYHGSTLVDSSTVAANTGVVVFDNLDMNIDAGDSEDFTVKVDLFGQTTPTNYTITATVVTSGIYAEDPNGDAIVSGDKTGSATSAVSPLTLNASTLTLDSTSHTQNSDGTLGTYTFRVTVTADQQDVVVSTGNVSADVIFGGCSETIAQFNAGTSSLSGCNDAADGTASVSVVKNSGTTTGTVNNYTVTDGNTATFTVTVTLDPAVAGSYFVRLNSINGVTTNDVDRVNGPESLS